MLISGLKVHGRRLRPKPFLRTSAALKGVCGALPIFLSLAARAPLLLAFCAYAIEQAASEKQQDVAQPFWQPLHTMTAPTSQENLSYLPLVSFGFG